MNARWPVVRLEAVLRQDTTYIDAPEPRSYPKLSVKLYGKGVLLDSPTDGASLKMRRHQLAKAGQVILSEIWGKKGAIGLVPEEGAGALCTSHFFLFDVLTGQIEPDYLRWIFKANLLEDELDAEAKGTTGYAAVRPKHLFACEIPLPPLPEQRRIVARIDKLAADLERTSALHWQSVRESDALWSAGLRTAFDRCEGQTLALETACTAIIDNLHSNPRYADAGVPCVRSPDVGYGTLDLVRALKTDEGEYQRRIVRAEPRPDDIVFVREGGGTGKCALVSNGQRFSLGQRVMMLRPDTSKVLPEFFLYQLLSPQIQEEQVAPLCKGSASPHLNIAALRRFRFVLPGLAEQSQVVASIAAVQSQVRQLRALHDTIAEKLNALMPAILDRAFRGEL